MNIDEALDAYLSASSKSWQTFLDYKFLKASEGQVAQANRYEAESLAVLRQKIAEVSA